MMDAIEAIRMALIPLGYPAETKEHPQRWDDSKVRYDGWK
jgi:hypothetical protein